MKLLVQNGANINEKTDDRKTPIYISAEAGKRETVDFLLAKGADPYLADKEGRTAVDVDQTG